MKKLLSVLMIALTLGTFASCNKKPGKAESTTAHDDSIAALVATFFGGSIAVQANDSIDGKDFDREDFLRGFTEAYESPSYVQGQDMGARLSQQINAFEQQFKIKIDREKFLGSFIKAAKNDNMTKEKLEEMSAQLQNLMMQAMMGGAPEEVVEQAPQAQPQEADEPAEAPQE